MESADHLIIGGQRRYQIRFAKDGCAMGPEMSAISHYILKRADKGFARFAGTKLIAYVTRKQRKNLLEFLRHHQLNDCKEYDEGARNVCKTQ